MHRKKKVETYDGEIDYFAPAIAQPRPSQPSSGASHVHNSLGYVHAAASSPQAPASVNVVPSLQATNPISTRMEQQPAQPVSIGCQNTTPPPPQSLAPMAPSYNTCEAEDHAAESHFDNDIGISAPPSSTQEYGQQQLSPVAVPASLRPISKGIKRSPSAGIISALAAAESMARADTSTDASASPAPSANGERMLSGSLPPLSSIGGIGGGSNSALPSVPFGNASAVTNPTMAAISPSYVPKEPEAGYKATSFAVCNAPIFSSEGGPSEFDAIADSADALDSFDLGVTSASGEYDATFTGSGSAWLPPAQAWQPSRAPAAEQQQERPPSAPVATQEVVQESPSVESKAPIAYEHNYNTVAVSPSPSPAPIQQSAQCQQQHKADDEDFITQIGDGGSEVKEQGGSDFMLPTGPGDLQNDVSAETSFANGQQPQQQYQQVKSQEDVRLGRLVTVAAKEEQAEEQQSEGTQQQQQQQQQQVVPGPELAPVTTEHTPGSTWYDDAGYCYYLSEDGWKYFWDNSSQQWQAHEYLGTSVGHIGVHTRSTKSADGQNDATTKVEQQRQEDVEEVVNRKPGSEVESAPAAEAPFSDFVVHAAPLSATVAQEHAVVAATAPAVAVAENNDQVTDRQKHQVGSQYSSYYEQQQQQQLHPVLTPPPDEQQQQQQQQQQKKNNSSFLPQQQPQAGGVDAHATPSTAPIPPTFVPSINGRLSNEFVATHPSPYMQTSITTTAPPAWGVAPASLPQQLQPQQHQQDYHHNHQPQHYNHEQKSLHPSCGFAKLTFGGRLVRVSPSGTITTHLLSALPEDVLRPVGADGGHTSIKGRIEMLNSFPGPLESTLNKEKAAAFFAARKEACVGEEPGSDAAALYTLWSVLEAQAMYPPTSKPGNASLQSTASSGGINGIASGTASNNAADTALAAALRQNAGVAAPITTNTQQSTASPTAAALQSIQDLVLSGRKAEALQEAVQCHAWPLALILASSLGAIEWQSAVEKYVIAALSPASPLSTVCMLTSGAIARAIPDPATNPAAAEQVLDMWRQHAAALAVGRMQGAEQALEALGEALLARGCVPQAHTCFVLAGVLLQPSDSTGNGNGQQQQHQHRQFAVVGASRTLAPRTYAALPVILRTEMFTWSRTIGNTQAVPNFLWVLPYKLLHAYALAEMGMLSQSAQYCSSILTTFQGLGNKVPPGLVVCRTSAADLNERLQQLAAARKVSLVGAQFNAGAIVSSVGKLLDRGISALMGGERQHSRSSSFTPDVGGGGGGAVTLAGHSRRSSVTTVPSSPLKAPTGGTASGAAVPPPQPGSVAHAEDSLLQPPKLLSSFMGRVASFKSIVTPEPTAAAVEASGDPSEPENAFYYDNELKIWRERGKPPPSPVEEPPPPPTAATWQTPPPGTPGAPRLSSSSDAGGSRGHAMPPPIVQQQHGLGRGGGGVSRYAMAPIGAAVASSPRAQASALLPQPAASVEGTFKPFNPAVGAAAGAAAGAPNFLTPSIGGNQTATPAQFVPQQQSTHSNSPGGYYGQPEMEEMSEVEL